MEEEVCFRCLRDSESVKLVDAIQGKEIVKVCEECALVEDIPIIRRPSSFQLKESEKPYTVYQRLVKMAGLKRESNVQEKKQEIKGITLDNLRKPKDYSQVYKEKQMQAAKINKPLDLVDNFNWHIQMARRNRKITTTQLAAMIGESEITLRMIESGSLPDDGMRIIDKIEQFFKIKLRKSEVEKERARIEQVQKPARILTFDKESVKNITISDLQRMKQERQKAELEEREREYASKVIWQGGKKLAEAKEEKPVEEISDEDIEILED